MTERTNPEKLAGSLVTKALRLRTAPILHGQRFEKVAVKKIEEITRQPVHSTGIGIFVSLAQPYLPSPPDGIIDEDSVVEVKCPYVARNSMTTRKIVPYIRQNGTAFSLDTNHDYYYQIQGQLFCAEKRNVCVHCVYFIDILFFTVDRNDNFISEMIKKQDSFYENCFKPALLGTRYFRSYQDCHCQK